ncbi:inverted formin-2-like [Mastacembelus armatus]|uniref:inverted formin-2-like n=1 Tax=Mastacembelus armatus TaxID=205130 RepID=UPI000E460AAD|nr:inverted formin-2-like [Mastacembelus armatus]XP_026152417.1 inverted formin-2-like [Mastacembelus armatus]XP_026152418.1 inverted formin-2-like [Mastacembelus armatus]
MQFGHQVTSSGSLQILPQPVHPILRSTILVQAIINPKRGMEGPIQQQTPEPPKTCSSSGSGGKACWNLDVKVAVLLLALAGAVILLLLYRLLQLRHRLRLARARHALEYHSFYHTATYTLKNTAPLQDLPAKNGTDAALLFQNVTTVTPISTTPLPPPPSPVPSLPPVPLPSPPVLPPLPVHPSPSLPPSHSLPPTPPVLALPLPLPVIHTTPPSPHLSWGACSDVDVYSRISSFRQSRLSSVSTHSKVILFEHSSL